VKLDGEGSAQGVIKYGLNVCILRKEDKDDPSIDCKVIVKEEVDVNDEKWKGEKIHEELQKFGNCCCPGGSITLEITTDDRASLPGETILIKGIIKNYSKYRTGAIRARLEMNSVLYGNGENYFEGHKVYPFAKGFDIAELFGQEGYGDDEGDDEGKEEKKKEKKKKKKKKKKRMIRRRRRRRRRKINGHRNQ